MSAQSLTVQDLARRFIDALSIRARRMGLQFPFELLENIYPGPGSHYWAQNQYAVIPMQAVSATTNYTWTQFWNLNAMFTIASRYNLSIATPVDDVVARAVEARIGPVQVYEYQAEAIVKALAALDEFRRQLRSRNTQNLNLSPRPEVLGIIAPPGAGKTEIFETIALQLALDAFHGGLGNTTLVHIVYSMRAFMNDHIRRFVQDIAYINNALNAHAITIGVWTGDTPRELTTPQDVEREFERLYGSRTCPIPGCQASVYATRNGLRCANGHDLSFIRLSRRDIVDSPPSILMLTPEQLNFCLLRSIRHNVLGRRGIPPALIVLDEPHSYTGVFGAHVSALIREYEYVVSRYASMRGSSVWKPLKLALSATLPQPREFLAKLFTVNPDDVDVVSFSPVRGQPSNRGFIFLLPSSSWGYQNAMVEIPVVLAAILPRHLRRVIVFVDSVDLANRLKYMIEDYIKRIDGFYLDYDVANNIGQVFQQDLVQRGQYNPDWARVAVHYADLPRGERRNVEEGLRSGRYNIVIATPTLELGIDVGEVAGCVMIGFPPTPDRFVQRAGRAGRRVPALIVVIANPMSAIDRWYFMNTQRIQQYLHTALGVTSFQRPYSQTYQLPLNPANLEVLRRWFGNHICAYVAIFRIRRPSSTITILNTIASPIHRNRCLDSYLDAHISKISQTSHPNYSRLTEIAQFASNMRSSLRSELERRLDVLSQLSHAIGDLRSLKIPNKEFRAALRSHLGFEPSAINLRSTNPSVLVEVYYPSYSIGRRPLRRYEYDVARAFVRFCLTDIGTIMYGHQHPIYRQPFRKLRGSIHFTTVHGTTLVCEVAGITNYSIMSPQVFQQFLSELTRLAGTLNAIATHSLNYDRQLIQYLVQQPLQCRIMPQAMWFNVLNHIAQMLSRHSLLAVPRVLTPQTFVLEPINQVFATSIPQGQLVHRPTLHRRTRTLWPSLPWLHVTSNNYAQHLEASAFVCPHCGSRRVEFSKHRQSHDLELRCLDCGRRWRYTQIVRNTRGIDEVRTDVKGYTMVLTQGINPVRVSSAPFFTLKYYRNVPVFMITYAQLIRGTNIRFSYPKYIGSKQNPNVFAYQISTDAIELEIDWTHINLSQHIDSLLKNVYSLINAGSVDIEDFKIRVTHTLSHLIMNFHSLFTGGNRWDVNEYIEIEFDSNRIVRTRILIHDVDEGGNGVSELIGYMLPDILWEAIDYCRARHNQLMQQYRRMHDPLIAAYLFLGEPGDTLIHGWPYCPYANIALSRAALLYFVDQILNLRNRQAFVSAVPRL